jgi:hypothetical protein
MECCPEQHQWRSCRGHPTWRCSGRTSETEDTTLHSFASVVGNLIAFEWFQGQFKGGCCQTPQGSTLRVVELSFWDVASWASVCQELECNSVIDPSAMRAGTPFTHSEGKWKDFITLYSTYPWRWVACPFVFIASAAPRKSFLDFSFLVHYSGSFRQLLWVVGVYIHTH